MHFVNDYRTFVKNLVASHPLDEAMTLAVGGGGLANFDVVGKAELEVLKAAGLKANHSVIDLGCGSGRLAKQLGIAFPDSTYLGVDVVQELLDYAALQSPPHFRFIVNEDISIPAEANSIDFVVAFSVFTHLFHEESYCYIADAKRCLRHNGKVVFSFLESRIHWSLFEGAIRNLGPGPMTMFIERPQIEVWAEKLGFILEEFNIGPNIGQSIAVLALPPLPP